MELAYEMGRTDGVFALERQETDELDHLSESCEILNAVLDFFQSVANCIHLMDDFEERVAHWAFMKEKVCHVDPMNWRHVCLSSTECDRVHSIIDGNESSMSHFAKSQKWTKIRGISALAR